MMKIGQLSCVWVILLVVSPACCAETLPTPQEISSLYRFNARVPRTLRVQWSIKRGSLQEGDNYYRHYGQKIRDGLEDNKVPAEQVDGFRKELKKIETRLQTSIESRQAYSVFDCWSDFRHFQMRTIRHGATSLWKFGEPVAAEFPEGLAQATELAVSFPDVMAVSFGPETDYRFRLWQADKVLPYRARVGLTTAFYDIWHAPLMMPPAEWQSIPHPCDRFYRLLEEGTGSVSTVQSPEGDTLFLVFASDGQNSARAFVDLSAGAIPRRIEWFAWVPDESDQHYSGHCESNPRLGGSGVTADIQIATFDCDGQPFFYPVSGRDIRYSMAASPEDAVSEEQPEIAAHSSTDWTVAEVTCNPEISPGDFALKFPPQTIFKDDGTGETYVTSEVENELTRVADTAISFAGRKKAISPVITFGLFCMFLLTVVAVCVWRRRARAKA